MTRGYGRIFPHNHRSVSAAFTRACDELKIEDLHFHDLRGTAATKFYLAGMSEREIGEIMGWEEESVRKIIRRYVDRQAAIKDRIRKLNEARK